MRKLAVAAGIVLLCLTAHAQDNPAPLDKLTSFPAKFFNRINEKVSHLESGLEKQTEKYLRRLARREQKLKKQLSQIDSNAAEQLFSGSEEQYEQLLNRIKTSGGSIPGQYLGGVDSLKTSLSFLQQNNELLKNITNASEKINGSLSQVNSLQYKLRESEQIKSFIRQRKEMIRQVLGKYTKLPEGLAKSFNDFNKEFYYYSQQVKEFRELLNDPDRLIQKGLAVLGRMDVFKQFMQQHSELASLFRLPGSYGSSQALTGLQTRTQVQQLVQTQLSAAGPNASQLLQQNLQAAQAQLSQLKDKINQFGGGSSDMDMPDFKPNNQRTKNFLKRIEYGTNVQSAKSNNFFPTTTDIGLSLGYKLNDKSIIGVGASYKIGWGKDFRHIQVTSEGIGLRSFADVKLKGSFYVSGGFEYNYQKPFSSLSTIQDIDLWQQSGLVGISKMVSLKTKFFTKTKLQLLWDFLSYQQTPRAQPLKFRVGYNF